MNINSSRQSRVASSFFFVFILLFSGIAQAVFFQRMIQKLPNVHQPKVEKVFGLLKELNIKPEDLSAYEIRTLVRALDDPTYLIKISPNEIVGPDLTGNLFPGRINARLFFSLFNLHKDSDALFTKLFARKNANKYEQLPFEEAKRNWEDFLGTLRVADESDYTQFTKTDLEAAAMSFVHRRFAFTTSLSRSSEAILLISFFNRDFHIGHYINPHFTLTPDDPHYRIIMSKVLVIFSNRHSPPFYDPDLINSKEFVLRIWKDATEEIIRQENIRVAGNVLLQQIGDSITRGVLDPNSSLRDQPFIKAMEAAGREDDDLAQLVDIVNKLASGRNLQNYRHRLLQQFREIVESQ